MKTKKLTHTTITTVAVLGTTADRDTWTGLWRRTLSRGRQALTSSADAARSA